MKRTVRLEVKVDARPEVSDAEVARLVDLMLNAGYADAEATTNDPDVDPEMLQDAEAVIGLDVYSPEVIINLAE